MGAVPGIDHGPTMEGLAPDERRILDFESKWWKYQGSKESSIREEFSISSIRYYQQLNHLLDSQAALAYNPMLVKRLRRMRSSRQRSRSARRIGVERN